MKKVLIVLLIAILAATPVVFAACSSVAQTDMLSDPYVADNAEIFTYKWYHKTDVIGKMTLTFRKVKAQDVTLPDPTAESGERTIENFTGTRLSMAFEADGVYNSDSGYSEVLYYNDYAPVYSYKHMSVGDTVQDMCVVYETKYAYTYLYENGERVNDAELKIKNTKHFDNEMLYAIIRASGVSQSSYTQMSFYSPNPRICALESISVSKMQDANVEGLAWAPLDETSGKNILPCYNFRISIANTFAKTYAVLVAQKPVTATFHEEDENGADIATTVENVKKVIVKIEEDEYSYILEKIAIL